MTTRKIIIGLLVTAVAVVLGFIVVSLLRQSSSYLKPPSQKLQTDIPQKAVPSESGITFEEDKKILPFPPNTLEVKRTTDGMQITWPALTSDRIAKYQVYRRPNNLEDWQLIATVPVQPTVSTYSYLDTVKSFFEYAVTSVTIYGTEGPKGPIATPKP
jgi:hypothetical protein